MLQDPLNDAMAVIKNAELAGKGECLLRPASKLVGRVLQVMQDADYVTSYERIEDGRGGRFRVVLKGNINNCGVISRSRSGGRTSRSSRPATCPRRTSAS